MARDKITGKSKTPKKVQQDNAKKASRSFKKEGAQVDDKLTDTARVGFADLSSRKRDRDLIGQKIEVEGYSGEVMSQWREGDNTIIVARVARRD